MLRWFARLLVLAVIAVVGVMIVSRLTNREEDFDDYDDLEGGFDFQETPVEIEVPAEQYAAVGSSAAPPSPSAPAPSVSSNGNGAQASRSQGTSGSTDKTSENGSRSESDSVSDSSASLQTTTLGDNDHLTDVVGIGPAFDARLKAIGINTLADLARADANSINEQVDVIGGVATVEDWIVQAKNLISPGASDGHN